MKLTKKFIKKVKAHDAWAWHDAEWHRFENFPEVEAVQVALTCSEWGDNFCDIKKFAEEYLAAHKEQVNA